MDVVVSLQSAYRFQDNTLISDKDRPPFPKDKLILPQFEGRVVFVRATESTPSKCAGSALVQRHCRQSFYRDRLLQAFDAVGGTDDDIALVSDEIPTATVLATLREKGQLVKQEPSGHQLVSGQTGQICFDGQMAAA